MRCFWAYFVLVFVFRGILYFLIGWSLWSCLDFIVSRFFILYFTFLTLATFALFCLDIHVRGSIFFFIYMFLVSTAY